MARWIWMVAALCCVLAGPAAAADKVALISSTMVLERKFKLMQEAARAQGVELAWTQVDAEGEKGVARVLDGARLVLVDAPRSDDQALIERVAGAQIRAARLPGVGIHVMSPPVRLRPMGLPPVQAAIHPSVPNQESVMGFLFKWIFRGLVIWVTVVVAQLVSRARLSDRADKRKEAFFISGSIVRMRARVGARKR